MFFKTYQKLLGASCLALYLAGCGGDSGEPLVEVEKNSFNSTVKIISKTDNIEIQDLKLNRGNCEHDQNFLVKLIQETANAHLFISEKEKAIKNHQAEIARLQKDLEELTQHVQQSNNLDKLLENEGLFVSGHDYKYTKDDNPIYVVKRMLDNLDSYKYESDMPYGSLSIILNDIRSIIKNTKNPKDYPYINLKELEKLIDSIQTVDSFLILNEYPHRVSKKGLQSLAELKSMWPSVGKFYFAYLKKAIPRQAKEDTDERISSEEKSIKAIQVKLTEAMQNIDKMEKLIKDLESKKNTMVVDLKFGETFTAHYKCQNLIEVGVKTDKGAWTFNFDR
ncbi:hypothetical protein ACQJ51_06735 [Helicobacter pylori]|uniref:hypothetical protein n=1 Tax=Helicobacter pylori TaxID=210 RepID=UPI0009A3D1E6|nr:hypothetical protein [Helicobacter pylori]MBH0253690.1 hypothetical protein [Helicobacter pylori]MBH0256489.1 hypothetical protein [Helicobacter pylori]MBH0289456.1 hypothetical protein [Helicobacter pylori]NHA21106.1 hypothetical protein [Helicobacter pylori]OPG50057.1 hypothetical protein BGL81_07075 [Helicobacter pylori]